MKEMGLRVEAGIRVAALTRVVASHSFGLVGISPPLACSLTRRRDHRIQQHEFGDWQPLAGKRRTEGTHRLGDQGDVFGRLGGSDDSVGVIGEGRARPIRQRHRDAARARITDEWLNELPISGIAAGAGNQDEAALPHGAILECESSRR